MTTPTSYHKELKEMKEQARQKAVNAILHSEPDSPEFSNAFIWIIQNESNEIAFKFINAKNQTRKVNVLKEKLIRVVQSQPEYQRYSPWKRTN